MVDNNQPEDTPKPKRKELAPLNIENTGRVLEAENRNIIQKSLDWFRENNRADSEKRKGRFMSVITIALFATICFLIINFDKEKDSLVKIIEEDLSLDTTEKVEKIQEIQDSFFDKTIGIIAPTFTLAIGFFLGRQQD